MHKRIGIITTWFERGAAYVSRVYMELLQKAGYEVFIFARGGEIQAKNDEHWNLSNVTWSKKGTRTFEISEIELIKWVEKNSISLLIFNEQQDFRILSSLKKRKPKLILIAYVDYYTEATLPLFNIYDLLICNTYRHLQAMNFHPYAKYLKWGTDISLYKPLSNGLNNDKITFFHSVGMSPRKGTDVLLNAFINGKLYDKANLIIHTQIPIDKVSNYSETQLIKYNIKIIQKTVTAPGLYYLGDVYVYPTRLDGLGLTMYEALASGLPVITTDYPPMNEVIDNNVGKLVKVERNYCRSDSYYWPMSVCDESDLIEKMNYYIINKAKISSFKKNARLKAKTEFNINDRITELSKIIEEASINEKSFEYIKIINDFYKKRSLSYKILRKLHLIK